MSNLEFKNLEIQYLGGRPYYSIRYTENGREFIGFSSYKLDVISLYLKDYFLHSAEKPEDTIRDFIEVLREKGKESHTMGSAGCASCPLYVEDADLCGFVDMSDERIKILINRYKEYKG